MPRSMRVALLVCVLAARAPAGGVVLFSRTGLEAEFAGEAPRIERIVRAFAAANDALVLEVAEIAAAEIPRFPQAIRARLGALDPRPDAIAIAGEKGIPRFRIAFGEGSGPVVRTDAFYGDLNADGIPEVPVVRVVGTAATIGRLLGPPPKPGFTSVILCSEDTRIHVETKGFLEALRGLGHEVAFLRGPGPERIRRADLLVHFGHGDPSSWRNRFGVPFLRAADLPPFAGQPIAIADGCGTAPPGAPIVRAFFERGGRAYVGASAVVMGMIPGALTNQLVAHFLDELTRRPEAPLAGILCRARARMIRAVPGLARALARAAEMGEYRGPLNEEAITAAEWIALGDPRARIPHRAALALPFRTVPIVEGDRTLRPGEAVSASVALRPGDGLAILRLRTRSPWSAGPAPEIVVMQDGRQIHRAGREPTIYQRIDATAVGGRREGDARIGCFLLPLMRRDRSRVEIRSLGPGPVILTAASRVEIWPPRWFRAGEAIPRGGPTRGMPRDRDAAARGEAGTALVLSKDEDVGLLLRLVGTASGLRVAYRKEDRAGLERFEGIPSPLEGLDLARYRLVVLDELERGRCSLPDGFLTGLAGWVRRGGRLLVCGGWYAYGGKGGLGGYDGSPLEDVLPVEILSKDDAVAARGMPRVGPDPMLADLAWDRCPSIRGWNRVRAKTGARALALVDGDPLIVVGTSGRGRTAALLTGFGRGWARELRRWPDYEELWGRILGWLLAGTTREAPARP